MEADALFGEHQLLEPGVLRNTAPLNIPLALHQLQDVGHGGAGDRELPLNVPLEHGGVPVAVEIPNDPPVHGGGLLHVIFAGKLVDLAEDQVVYPADLRRDDLWAFPRGIGVIAALVFGFVTHHGFVLHGCFGIEQFQIKLFDSIHIIQQSK